MSSQADLLDTAGSGRAARGVFGLSPSSFSVYPFQQWQAAWHQLEACWAAGQSLVVLLGDPGTGKSTMLERLASALAGEGKSVKRLRGAQLDGRGVLQLAAITLGLDPDIQEQRALETQVRAHLQARCAREELYFLVDDADLLEPSALASLLDFAKVSPDNGPRVHASSVLDNGPNKVVGRPASELPGSARSPSDRLGSPTAAPEAYCGQGVGQDVPATGLRIVLAGSPRLLSALHDCFVDVENRSQVGVASLGALTALEMHAYLTHCLARSRASAGVAVSTAAAEAIFRHSRGIARVANRIAGRLLFQALESKAQRIELDDVGGVIDDLKLEGLLDDLPPDPQVWTDKIRDAAEDGGHDAALDIDKSVADLIAAELRAPVSDERGAVQKSSSATELSPGSSHSLVGPRRARILVPALAAALAILVLAIGLQLRIEEFFSDSSENGLSIRSDEPAAGLAEAKKLGVAAGSRVSGETSAERSRRLAMTPPPTDGEDATAESSVAEKPAIEPEALPTPNATESAAKANLASLSVLREERSSNPQAGRVRDPVTALDSDESEAEATPSADVGGDVHRASQGAQAEELGTHAGELEPTASEAQAATNREGEPRSDSGDSEDAVSGSTDVKIAIAEAGRPDQPQTQDLVPSEPPSEAHRDAEPVFTSSGIVDTAAIPSSAAAANAGATPLDLAQGWQSLPSESAAASAQEDSSVPIENSTDESGAVLPLTAAAPSAETVDREVPQSDSPVGSEEKPLVAAASSVVVLAPPSDLQPSSEAVESELPVADDDSDVGEPTPSRGRTVDAVPAIALLEGQLAARVAPDLDAQALDEQRVRELLNAADVALKDNRLTTPAEDNAFQHYRAVLDIDPGNARALEGLEDIAWSYVALIERARADGEVERALAYLDRAESVLPGFPETENLRSRVLDDLSTVNRSADAGDEPRAPPAERFVMLPVKTSASCAWPFDRHMTDAVRKLIASAALDWLELSAPVPAAANADAGGSRFWLGSGSSEVPNHPQVYHYGERVGARWVLLARVDCPNSAVVYEPWREFQIHLFDIERGVAHQQRGSLGELASITERVLLGNIAVNGG